MHNYKIHIALFLVIVLNFSMFNTSLHFVLISHSIEFKKNQTVSLEISEEDSHDCNHEHFTLPKFVDFSHFDLKLYQIRISQTIDNLSPKYFSSEIYEKSQIRGPPSKTTA